MPSSYFGTRLGRIAPVVTAPVAGAAKSLVQHAVNAAGVPASCACTLGSGTTAANLLILMMRISTSRTIASVADNASGGSNTWVQCTGAFRIDNTLQAVDIWYAANVKAGTTVITPTLGGSGGTVAIPFVFEVSGCSTTSPFITANSNAVTSNTTPVTGASVTTTAANAFLAAICASSSVATIFSGNPFANVDSGTTYVSAQYIPTSIGTYFPKWDLSVATQCAIATAVFQ